MKNLKLFLQNKKTLVRNILLIVFGVILLGFIGVELFLRFHYGLCDAVLMRADDDYEYIAKPNQDRKRLGNQIKYNRFSMRSEELRDGSLRILCIGDSILNGGTLTDHEYLATSLLSRKLSETLQKDVQVLNVSAGSWGPDNCAAYLKKHGHFGASAIFLITSSHDARDTMTFVPVVGKLKYFPVKQYPLAVIELLDRYLNVNMSFFHKTKDEVDSDFRKQHNIEQASDKFNPGYAALLKYAKENKIPLYLYLHANQDELKGKKLEPLGDEIISFAKENKILLYNDLTSGLDVSWFRDPIHYGVKGQKKMAEILYPEMEAVLKGKE